MSVDAVIPAYLKTAAETVAEAGELAAFWPEFTAALAGTNGPGEACEAALARAGLRPEVSWALANAVLAAGDWAPALRIISSQCIAKGWLTPGDAMWTALIHAGNMAFYRQVYEALTAQGFFRQAAESRGLLGDGVPAGRPVLIASMARSGTAFITNTFTHGLGRPFVSIFSDTYPQEQLVCTDLAAEVRQRRVICVDHFRPTPATLAALTVAGFEKVHVHLRDPRQATLSWLHHMDRRFETDILAWPRYRGLQQLPADYRQRSRPEKLAWLAAHYYPRLIDWVRQWLDAAAAENGIEVQIGEYQAFRDDPLAYLGAVARFFDPGDVLAADGLPDRADPSVHYRRADPGEWRREFPAESLDAMNAALPGDMAERFGWPAA